MAFVIIFKYAAYPGLRIAFMNYKPAKGYAGSEWVGWGTFEKIFKDKDFIRSLKNSLAFNFLDLIVGFPVPIILALMLNELRFKKFKRVSQTILYLPHFLSWVIIASVALSLFKPESGLVNILLKNAGIIKEGIPFLTEKWHWAVSYLVIGIWQNMGWGTIIYLAAINVVSFFTYGIDKLKARKDKWRIPEATLPWMAVLGGSIGAWLGMKAWHHKTLHKKFKFGVPAILIIQLALALFIWGKIEKWW